MVPLHEPHGVGAQHGVDLPEEVVAHLGPGEVEHLLVTVHERLAVARREHPVGMGTVEVGVGVHHLGLEPQPELHPETTHVLRERPQALGPHLAVHLPVTEPRGVVAAVAEPSVVQHEELHAHPGRAVRDLAEPVHVVVEVDRLPDVEHDRLHVRVRRQGPLPLVPASCEAVQPVVGRPEHHPGGRVLLARREGHLTGQQQLATPECGAGGGVALPPQDAVAAPGDVGRDHNAVRGGEPGGPEDGSCRRPQARPSATALAQPRAVGDLAPLRAALALVPTGEVQRLGEPVLDREHHLEPVHEVGARGGVGHGVTGAHEATCQGLHLGEQGETGRFVAGAHDEAGLVVLDAVADEPRRPREPGRPVVAEAVATQVGPGVEAAAVLTEKRNARGAGPQRRDAVGLGSLARCRVEQAEPHQVGPAVPGVRQLEAGDRGRAGGEPHGCSCPDAEELPGGPGPPVRRLSP